MDIVNASINAVAAPPIANEHVSKEKGKDGVVTYVGVVFAISFLVVLVLIFSPVFGNGKNGSPVKRIFHRMKAWFDEL